MEHSCVQCDESGCDWSQPVNPNEIENWHNQPYPKCGEGVIVNDEDLLVVNMIIALSNWSDQVDPYGELPRETLIIDTGVLRGCDETT